MRSIVLVVHNIRSAYNVGALLRTAEGLGLSHVYLTGYTPYPATRRDSRLPHIASRVDRLIQKTALGAEKLMNWSHEDNIFILLDKLRRSGYQIAALEQTKKATPLQKFIPVNDIALVVGSEIDGLEPKILAIIDEHVEIPMQGQKESFNVAIAAAIALYYLKNQ
ncbi:TrmH family RNA methyltransferase [Candidatus Saccharibacteria bacterium]|nr:TrmH family RNA methyltransferase [Candidatus Saccharibacteria bacterium]